MKKKIIFSLISLCLLASISSSCGSSSSVDQSAKKSQDALNTEVAKPTPAVNPDEGKTELFVDIGDIHGLVFDNQGSMYVGKEGKVVLKVTPDAKTSVFADISKLADKTDKTYIWSLILGNDNNIYAAAGDRILKITSDGSVQTLIKEEFEGNWGACDVKFDQEGNIYVVHGKKMEKFTPDKKKTTIVNGDSGEIKITAAVGMCFDKDFGSVYLSDLFGGKVIQYQINAINKNFEKPQIIQGLPSPEYIAVSEDGTTFVTLPGAGKLAKIDREGTKTILACENKLLEPWSVVFGKKGFDENSLYVISRGKVFRVQVNCKGL